MEQPDPDYIGYQLALTWFGLTMRCLLDSSQPVYQQNSRVSQEGWRLQTNFVAARFVEVLSQSCASFHRPEFDDINIKQITALKNGGVFLAGFVSAELMKYKKFNYMTEGQA
mgnify:CR=1 FL=1